jgi:NAD+ synthase (glutamine-hydrolysing)
MAGGFGSLYRHGFVRLAVCIPKTQIGDCRFNADRIIELAGKADADGTALALFPELGLTGYSLEDLFHQDTILQEAHSGLRRILEASRGLRSVLIVGLPVRIDGALHNCAVAVCAGRILGATAKTYLPNYREFYEKRQFAPATDALRDEIDLCGERVPFGTNLVFGSTALPHFSFHMEICEDLWAPIPPSTYAAISGATVLTNLSASNITIGKAEYRRKIASAQSGKCIAAYMYSAAGEGESTTDLAWDGQGLIYENGRLMAEGRRFCLEDQVISADVDLEALEQDRMRMTSYLDARKHHRDEISRIRRIPFDQTVPEGAVGLRRVVARFPYVPSRAEDRNERCYEAYNIQVHGLLQRLRSTEIQRVVIGVSGGLDSTHALIVAARTMDKLGLDRRNILAYTMPGFATSSTTKSNATALMSSLGVSSQEIDIRPSCMQMFADIGHPFADGEEVYDVTFENVQAGERTSHLFRLANYHRAMVVGTGDLSELALGWATYGVGDHMSHYNVNASVPKTLIQYLIRWVVDSRQFDEETNAVLLSILGTEISPELVPGEKESEGPAQSTEDIIGPYELQDFNLYYLSRYGFKPSKVAYLALQAWGDVSVGGWPEALPEEGKHEYSISEIKRWLRVFLRRFFKISQFKRSCLPNGPKVGSGGSLSPRGDWRAPSDSEADAWLIELEDGVPDTL